MSKRQLIILGVVLGLALVGLILIQARYFQTAFKLKKAQFDYSVNNALGDVVSYLEEQDKIYAMWVGDSLLMDTAFRQRMHVIFEELNYSGGEQELTLVEDESELADDFLYKNKDTDLSGSFFKYRQRMKKMRETKNTFASDMEDLLPVVSLEERLKGVDIQGILSDRLKDNGVYADFEFAIKEQGKFIVMSQRFFNKQSEYTYTKQLFLGNRRSQASIYLIFPYKSEGILHPFLMLLPSLIITLVLIFCSVFCLIIIVRQKRLSAIKNDFINNMTHEFKTPIATISLAAQMLKDGTVEQTPGSVDHMAGIIKDESKRLTYQIEKVLQTSLFTENRMRLKLKKVNLNEIIANLMNQFRLRVENQGGKLLGHLNAEDDEIWADEVHITNVISNLLDNAIKYCTKAPEIGIYTRNKGEDIIVSVIDNGIGIATKDQKLIFERFYRVSTGNLHDVKGFGLGLSYVKKIVETHNGRVELESALGKGSRFDVVLPLASKKLRTKRTLFFKTRIF